MIKAVVFDLDDTLISEKEYIESGYSHIASLLSRKLEENPEVVYDELMLLFKTSPKNVFNRLLDIYEIKYTEEDIKGLVEEYRNHQPLISFYPDVLPCLRLLKERGIKTGIITDGFVNAQRNKLMTVGAYDLFDEVIITDEMGIEYRKPHPRAYELMRERLNVEFDEMIFIGDNPEKDFHIGNTYPIKTIRIHRKGVYQDKKYLNDIRENNEITSLDELEKYI